KEYELVKNSNQFKTNNPKIAQETLYGFFPSSLFLSDITAGTKNIKSTITPIKIKNNKEIEMIIPPLYFTTWTVCRRSEEHTSELQSHFDLVWRLLLVKT